MQLHRLRVVLGLGLGGAAAASRSILASDGSLWLLGWLILKNASPFAPFDEKVHHRQLLRPTQKCTFVNGGLWLVKKINVVFLLVYFPSMKWAGWPWPAIT